MADLAAPHTLLGVTSVLLGNPIVNGSADLLDPCGRVGQGDMEGRVNMVLKASLGVGSGEAGQAAIEGLPLYFQ